MAWRHLFDIKTKVQFLRHEVVTKALIGDNRRYCVRKCWLHIQGATSDNTVLVQIPLEQAAGAIIVQHLLHAGRIHLAFVSRCRDAQSLATASQRCIKRCSNGQRRSRNHRPDGAALPGQGWPRTRGDEMESSSLLAGVCVSLVRGLNQCRRECGM